MVDCLTYIIFDGLAEDKCQEIREWVKKQPQSPRWEMWTGRMDDEHNNEFAVVTTYHYSRMKLPLYIYQLYQKYNNDCRMHVELWSDMEGGMSPDDYYALDGKIETDADWADFLSEYTPEEWKAEIQKNNEYYKREEVQIAMANSLKALDKLKKNQEKIDYENIEEN